MRVCHEHVAVIVVVVAVVVVTVATACLCFVLPIVVVTWWWWQALEAVAVYLLTAVVTCVHNHLLFLDVERDGSLSNLQAVVHSNSISLECSSWQSHLLVI